MTRNLPAALTRVQRHPASPDNAKPNEAAKHAEPARPQSTDPIVLYLAVPDPRLIPILARQARIFASRRSAAPLELRIFHEPNLPNTPFDDLSVLATLTEFGDVEGITYVTVKPEDLK